MKDGGKNMGYKYTPLSPSLGTRGMHESKPQQPI